MLRYRNKSGQNYVLSELGEIITIGKKEMPKGRSISADSERTYVFTEDEISACPLLRELIASGAFEQVVDTAFSDDKVTAAINSDQVIVPVSELIDEKEEEPKPDPHAATHAPRDILVDDSNKRPSVLVDQDQYAHVKSVYDDGSSEKKKN